MVHLLDIIFLVLFCDRSVLASGLQIPHLNQTVMIMFNAKVAINHTGDIIMPVDIPKDQQLLLLVILLAEELTASMSDSDVVQDLQLECLLSLWVYSAAFCRMGV